MVVVAVVEALANVHLAFGCENLQVASTVVKPPTSSVHQSCGIHRIDNISQGEFWVLSVHNLAPTLIVDNPGDNTGIATVLSDQELQLALEFLLLLGVRKDCFQSAVVESPGLGGSQRRHVLD